MGHLEHFAERGYVVMRGLLDPAGDLQPVVDEYSTLADLLAEGWLRDGKLSSYDSRQPLPDRLHHLLRETGGSCFQYFEISLPMDRICEDTPIHLGPAIFGLLKNPRLLAAVETLIGPEIYANPVQHTRIKPPEHQFPRDSQQCLTSRTFWHQDLGVIAEEADHSNIVSAFIPFTETTVENGCVIVVPGSHKGGLAHHCRTVSANGIPEASVGDWLPMIMKPGDVLFLDKLTQHASLANLSGAVRWSFDLRFGPVGQPTGRPWFPGFVARSKAHPEQELSDYEAWVKSWHEARSMMAANRELPKFTRWPWDPRNPARECPVCAVNEPQVAGQMPLATPASM